MSFFAAYNRELESATVDDLKKMINRTGMPYGAMVRAERVLEKLAGIEGSARYSEGLDYVRYLVDLPWGRTDQELPVRSVIERTIQESIPSSNDVVGRITKYYDTVLSEAENMPKILVVDDEKIALNNLERALTKSGYSVVTADNGTDAIETLKQATFDLVITDLIMGGVDGNAVLKEVKNNYPSTQVIMVTGYATVDTAVDAMRGGAYHYIEKPVKLDELRDAVKGVVGKSPFNCRTSVLCFSGSSADERRSLAKVLAQALGRKFVTMSMSGLESTTDIWGQSREQGEARPGGIIDLIRLSGVCNPVFMLDEIDKVSEHLARDYQTALIDLVDPLKNQGYVDNYVGIPFNLSDVVFMASIESVDSIGEPLREYFDFIILDK